MRSFTAVGALALLSLFSSVASRPVPSMRRAAFVEQPYSAFQISSGTAGTAESKANAVFVDPFAGVDLASVDKTTLKAVQNMREAAEAAESDYNSALSSASGDAKTALQNGKIQNKVLKLTAEVQALKIQQAQGKDTSAALAVEQKKLTNNIALDTKAAGGASTAIADSPAALKKQGTVAAAATTTSTSSSNSSDSTATADASASNTTDSSSSDATPVAATGGAFVQLPYSQFQISGGVGGSAEAEANAIFVDPFGSDLASVSAADIKTLQSMRLTAEAAEGDFNNAITAASGDALAALKVGKTKNKVLKLTAEVQVLKIQAAQGKDTSKALAVEQKKLSTNVAADVKNKGAASTAIADSPAAIAEQGSAVTSSAGAPAAAAPAAAATTAEAAAPAAATTEAAAPAAATSAAATTNTAAAGSFKATPYSEFQISSGTGGDAAAKANAIFVDPFGSDLASVSAADIKSLQSMRLQAEGAEADFNSALSSATGDAKTALQVGKIQNKVLKLTAEVQVLKIQQAQGKDTSKALAVEQKKLSTNIATDVKNKGAASTAIPDSAEAKKAA